MEENKKIILEITNMESVQSFLKTNNLDNKIVDENLLTFYSYKIKHDKCQNCKGLDECRQNYEGLFPKLEFSGKQIIVNFSPCKYLDEKKAQIIKNSHLKLIATSFDQYNFNDVFNTQERKNLLVKIAGIYNSYKNGDKTKGIYVYGPYGCGKSYMLAWLAVKLSEMNANVIFAYYPDLVRKLKKAIGDGTLEEEVEELKNIEVLMIDDIGGESNTDFIRDEVLGAILQTRMTNNSLTFMSSNLEPKLLIDHLSTGTKDVDLVKGLRVFERIKTLMDFVELKDKNYR